MNEEEEQQLEENNEHVVDEVQDLVEDQPEVKVDPNRLEEFIEKLRLEQNLPMALIGGAIAALIGAILWAVITVATEYQIGFMAIAVGFLVGFTVRYTGKGIDNAFGIVGAVFALLGCVMGNFLSIIGFVASSESLGYLEVLGMIDFALIPEIMIETFNPIDLLFYGFAIYEGYKFSFRQLTDEEIIENAAV